MIRSVPTVFVILSIFALACFQGCGSKCDEYEAQMRTCIDSYCSGTGANAAVCECWAVGNDVDTSTCTCKSWNWDDFCNTLEDQGVNPDQVVSTCQDHINDIIGACPGPK